MQNRGFGGFTAFKEGPLSFNSQDFGAGWVVLTANLKTNATCALGQLRTGVAPLNCRYFLITPN